MLQRKRKSDWCAASGLFDLCSGAPAWLQRYREVQKNCVIAIMKAERPETILVQDDFE